MPKTDRKSTRLNSSHLVISYAVFCLKKKNKTNTMLRSDRRHEVPVQQAGTRARRPSIDAQSGCRCSHWVVFFMFLIFFFFKTTRPHTPSPFPPPPSSPR